MSHHIASFDLFVFCIIFSTASVFFFACGAPFFPSSLFFLSQVAAVELRNFTAGVYVCANGGNCSAPDTCRCATGWAGFDCRTPVCDQGYHVPLQERFVAGTLLENEVKS